MVNRRIENESRALWGGSYATMRLMATLYPYCIAGALAWYGGWSLIDLFDDPEHQQYEFAAETGAFALLAIPAGIFVMALLSYLVTRAIYNDRVSRLPPPPKH